MTTTRLAYRYRAVRDDGKQLRGLIEAATIDEAGALLRQRGLMPIRLLAADPETLARPAARRRDLAIAFASIAGLVEAGVPLERALASSEPLSRGALRDTFAQARARVHEGQSFAQALDESRGVIPASVIGMVRAGERASRLAPALTQAADHLEQEAEMIARVRQALAYPLLLLVAGGCSVGVIATVVLPRFAEVLGDLGQALPASTRALLAASAAVQRYAFVAIPVGLGALAAAVAWARHPSGRRVVDRVLLAAPVIGPLRHHLASARLCRALGAMLESGMPLLPALDAARDAAGDTAIAARLARARDRIREGVALTAAFAREDVTVPNALDLLRVGESTGRLGSMALRAGTLAAREAERGIRTVITLLEPALVVVFGGIVAFVAAALLQAVYAIRPAGL